VHEYNSGSDTGFEDEVGLQSGTNLKTPLRVRWLACFMQFVFEIFLFASLDISVSVRRGLLRPVKTDCDFTKGHSCTLMAKYSYHIFFVKS
jgi:hypothetical protein